jgi:hypothetical protein
MTVASLNHAMFRITGDPSLFSCFHYLFLTASRTPAPHFLLIQFDLIRPHFGHDINHTQTNHMHNPRSSNSSWSDKLFCFARDSLNTYNQERKQLKGQNQLERNNQMFINRVCLSLSKGYLQLHR